MITISNSEIGTWKRCPRQWYLTYYLGMVPADEPATGARQLGSRIHTALEGYYGYQLDPLAVFPMLYAIEARRRPEFEGDLFAEQETGEIMLSGYLEWLNETGADADFETVATETDLRVPLPGVDGVTLRARMDQVRRQLSTGWLSFEDYKTAASFEAHETLALSPQFKFYSLMQQLAAGLEIGQPPPEGMPAVMGGTITTLRRVKRTEKSKPPYYQRDSFRYNPEQISATLLKVQRAARQIATARLRLDEAYAASGGDLGKINAFQREFLPPTEIPADCKWSCPHVQLCPMLDDGSDWPGALMSSGRYKQDDPYAYYRSDSLRAIREELARL